MEPFDALRLSRQLAGRKIVFVGGALIWQQFQSLQKLMCSNERSCAVSTALDPDPYVSHFVSLHNAVFQIQVRSGRTCTCCSSLSVTA